MQTQDCLFWNRLFSSLTLSKLSPYFWSMCEISCHKTFAHYLDGCDNLLQKTLMSHDIFQPLYACSKAILNELKCRVVGSVRVELVRRQFKTAWNETLFYCFEADGTLWQNASFSLTPETSVYAIDTCFMHRYKSDERASYEIKILQPGILARWKLSGDRPSTSELILLRVDVSLW